MFLYNRNENLLTLYLEIRSFGKIVLHSLTTHAGQLHKALSRPTLGVLCLGLQEASAQPTVLGSLAPPLFFLMAAALQYLNTSVFIHVVVLCP